MNVDIASIRRDTPCINAYFDHTAASVPPKVVVDAVAEYYSEILCYGPKWFSNLERHYELLLQTRRDLGKIVNAKYGAEEIALTTSGSEGFAIVADGMDWKDGDEIILSRAEMIANVVPWLKLRPRGVKVLFADIKKPGLIDLESVKALISPKTRLISLTHAPNTLGTIQELDEIGSLARARGILFMVDACATAGVVPVDVQALNCDFLCATGRKYLRAPAGTGFLYVRRDRVPEVRPLLMGWKAGTWDYRTNEFSYHPTAERFYTSEPNFPGWIGLGRAAAYVFEVGGVKQIFERVTMLTAYAWGRLSSIKKVQIIGAPPDRRNGILNIVMDGYEPKQVAEHLQARGIIVEAGAGYCIPPLNLYEVNAALRIALHYWNTTEEIDRAVRVLRALIK